MSNPVKITRVAVIVAMEQEILPLLKILNARRIDNYFSNSRLPMHAYEARIGQMDILFSTNGNIPSPRTQKPIALIGTVPAIINTLSIIETFHPDLIVSSGTAGGFQKRGSQIGDVYLCSAARFHDRRISLPGFEDVAKHSWPCFPADHLRAELKVKSGIVSTGDSFDMSTDDLKEMTDSGADVKEMEAAAIAFLCHQLNVPFLALKAITDLVDSFEVTAHQQFLRNLATASENLCKKLGELLQSLSTKPLL
jgi:5'-methylthioadenosine nucleosidase